MVGVKHCVRALLAIGACVLPALASGKVDPYITGLAFTYAGKSCGPFVISVMPTSPAEKAGIKVGDKIIAVGDTKVSDMDAFDIGNQMRSEAPGTVALTIKSVDGNARTVQLDREKATAILERNHQKVTADGAIFPADATDAEIKSEQSFDANRISGQVFPSHYPQNMELCYPGLELLVLKNPDELMVGAVENGPAKDADLRWGDIVKSINGTNPAGKNTDEIQKLLTSEQPSTLHLEIVRMGTPKTIDVKLAKASDVVKLNHERMFNGQLVPEGLADEDAECLLKAQ